jgi:hypothetical protein
MARHVSTSSFSARTVPLELFVDVKSLQTYHTVCPLTRTALDSSSNARPHTEPLSQKLQAQPDNLSIPLRMRTALDSSSNVGVTSAYLDPRIRYQ